MYGMKRVLYQYGITTVFAEIQVNIKLTEIKKLISMKK